MSSQSVFISILLFGFLNYPPYEKMEWFAFMLKASAVFIYISVSVARHDLLKEGTTSLYRTFLQWHGSDPCDRVKDGLEPLLSLG